jgi:hypothetical protein
MIYYLAPGPSTAISGGLRKLYDHVAILQQNGFDAVAVDTTKETPGPRPGDLLVVPEVSGYILKSRPGVNKILFCQNGYLLKDDTQLLCEDLVAVMVESQHTKSIVENKRHGDTPIILTHPCVNGRDGKRGPFRFAPWEGRKKEIIYFQYKHEHVLDAILNELPLPRDWKLVCMTGMTDEQVAEAYRTASIFLAPNQREGLCAPTMEALISGTCIVGWYGGGTKEYLEGRAFMAKQDDVADLRELLVKSARSIGTGLTNLPTEEWSTWIQLAYSREQEVDEIVGIMEKYHGSRAGRALRAAETAPAISNPPANQPPVFSILHATAHRLPYGWIEAWRAWSNLATHPEAAEYVLCVHESDIDKVKEGVNSLRDEPGIHLVVCTQSNRYCAVDNWNTAAKASKGRVLIMGADDFFPPGNWDGALIDAAVKAGKNPLEDVFAIHVNVGSGDPNVASHPIMSRALYEKWGYFLFPEYEGVYCDNDFTDHARVDGVMIDARDLLFDHRHPIREGHEAFLKALKEDVGYAAQNRTDRYQRGDILYQRRKANGFKNSNPLIRDGLKNLFICAPGETFSSQWMNHWTALMLALPLKFNVFPCNVHCSNVYTTRLALAKEALTNQPKPDYILWLDDDNLVTVDNVLQLIKDLDDYPEMDMVAGWCWIQADDPANGTRVSCGVFHKDGSCQPLRPDAMLSTDGSVPPVLEIEWTGFPVVLMRYSCLEKAGANPFSPVPTLHGRFGFMGEDVAFCRVAKDRGNCRFLVDRRVQVPHLKLRPVAHNNFATLTSNPPVPAYAVAGERKN